MWNYDADKFSQNQLIPMNRSYGAKTIDFKNVYQKSYY